MAPVRPGIADGRVQRRLHNRESVVSAFLALMEEGHPDPTAKEIAVRAGVSTRTVFQHFKDREQIYEVAGRQHLRRLAPLLAPVDVGIAYEARLDEFVTRRHELLEQLDPVARAARLREPFSPRLQANRAAVVSKLRVQCAATFAPELDAVGGADSEAGATLLIAVTTASSWAAWYHLRNDQELGRAAAAKAMRSLLAGVLEAATAKAEAGPVTSY